VSLHVCEVRRVPASVCGRRNATFANPQDLTPPERRRFSSVDLSEADICALNFNLSVQPIRFESQSPSCSPTAQQGWAWGVRPGEMALLPT
jgi:hypothetical protein